MDFCGSPFCDYAFQRMKEKRNVAAESNPEVRDCIEMQILIEQLLNECLISARHCCRCC